MVRWGDLRREPFRLLFPLGILFGLLGVGHWLWYALGWTDAYSGFYHASIQLGAYMYCFVTGFLLTALPRFTSASAATTPELLTLLALLLAQLGFASWGRWPLASACFAGLLLVLAVFAGRRVAGRRSVASPPTEFVWIPIGALLGLAGSGLLGGAQSGILPAWLLGIGRPMAQQGFMTAIVLGVGGFMAPRLMGRGYLVNAPTDVTEERARAIRKRRIHLHLLAALVFLASFLVEGVGRLGPAYLLRALVVTVELAWTTQFYRPPAAADLYVRLVWVSLWMVVFGFWGAGVIPRYKVAMLHVVFLGGFSLMTFAVGTMVVLSHAGQAQQVRRPLGVLWVVGAGLAGALICRLLAETAPSRYFQWLGLAAGCWMAAGLSWLLFILPRVLRPVPAETFERLHEAAKRQLLAETAAR